MPDSHEVERRYEAWAKKQLEDPFREIVLQWKAIHLANIFKRNLPGERVVSICEIGGAEGTVLFVAGRLLGARSLINFEPCRLFCETGKRKYRDIRFRNTPFARNGQRYDIIILSDVLEHVEDEEGLLATAGESCRFALLKMPIERSLSVSSLGYFLRGQARPPEMLFGPNHYNGHLRGYSLKSALAAVHRNLEVMGWYALDHSFYYQGSALFVFLRKWLGMQPLLRGFGGSLFILDRREC